MDIAEWLRSLDLAQYAQAFAENDIDAGVLSELSDADLEKIGVSLGHRKKLLKAITAGSIPACAQAALDPPRNQRSEDDTRLIGAATRRGPGHVPGLFRYRNIT